MRIPAISLFLLPSLLLYPRVADAAGNQVTWFEKSDLNTILDEARDRNQPVMIFMRRSPSKLCDKMAESFKDGGVVAIVNGRVIAIEIVTGAGNTAPPEKEAILKDLVNIVGTFNIPAIFVLTPDGKEMTELRALGKALAPGEIAGIVQAASKKTGEGIGSDEAKKLREAAKKAEESFGLEQYKPAIAELTKISKHKAQNAGIVKSAKIRLGEIEQKGKALCEEARGKAEAQQWEEAKKIYDRVAKEFAGLDVAREAADALKEVARKQAESERGAKPK